MREQDRRAAARQQVYMTLTATPALDPWIRANAILTDLESAGYRLTAPDAPSGTVCIDKRLVHEILHVLPGDSMYRSGDIVRKLRDILAAAEGGPHERGEGD